MKLYVKSLVGGVLAQGTFFFLVYLLAAINIDERAPNLGQFLFPILYLSIPGILLLVPEGSRHPHHRLLFAVGVIINILIYATVIFIVLGLMKLRRMKS